MINEQGTTPPEEVLEAAPAPRLTLDMLKPGERAMLAAFVSGLLIPGLLLLQSHFPTPNESTGAQPTPTSHQTFEEYKDLIYAAGTQDTEKSE